MKTFLRDVVVFLIVQALLAAGMVQLAPSREGDYLSAIIDKHERLAGTPAPRIILIGGSNLAFGMDSSRLLDGLGYHPVNMALHAGLGLPFMISEVRPCLESGDIIVICPEYGHFSSHATSELPTLTYWSYAGSVRYFSTFAEWKTILDAGLIGCGQLTRSALRQYLGGFGWSWQHGKVFRLREMLKNATRRPGGVSETRTDLGQPLLQRVFCTNIEYLRSGFNEYGDFISHWDKPSPATMELYQPQYRPAHEERVIDDLNSFYGRCRAEGVQVFFAYPSYPQADFEAFEKTYMAIINKLESRLSIPRLGNYQDVLYPRELFFDTPYHLTRKGVVRRTDQLVAELRLVLQETNEP